VPEGAGADQLRIPDPILRPTIDRALREVATPKREERRKKKKGKRVFPKKEKKRKKKGPVE